MVEYSLRQKVIRLALIKCGVRCDFVAYDYLAFGIDFLIDNPCKKASLVYRKIAREFASGTAAVEVNIKNAISISRQMRDFLNEAYGSEVVSEIQPSALRFMNLIAGYYTLGLYKKDGLLE